MVNNERYVDILDEVVAYEESQLITIIIFGIALVLITVLLPSKMLTFKGKKSQKKYFGQKSQKSLKKQKPYFCYKPILIMFSFIILVSGMIYKTVELGRINDDICEENFIIYEGLFQYDSLYHDYYYGRVDFLDENQSMIEYAFYPDRTNSYKIYPNYINELPKNQICSGIVVYSAKSKIIVDLIITK